MRISCRTEVNECVFISEASLNKMCVTSSEPEPEQQNYSQLTPVLTWRVNTSCREKLRALCRFKLSETRDFERKDGRGCESSRLLDLLWRRWHLPAIWDLRASTCDVRVETSFSLFNNFSIVSEEKTKRQEALKEQQRCSLKSHVIWSCGDDPSDLWFHNMSSLCKLVDISFKYSDIKYQKTCDNCFNVRNRLGKFQDVIRIFTQLSPQN